MFVISRAQIDLLQQVLESVTGQNYTREIAQNSDGVLLIAWKNDTHINYLLHIVARSYDSFQFCLAQQRWRDIQERYDCRLSKTEMLRLLNDPRQCVRYWVGQVVQ